MRPKAKPSAQYRSQCDILFSRIIRSKGYCEWCGARLPAASLQCCHVISRSVLALRYDPDNAFCGCYRCHLTRWHKEPLQAARWFENQFPGRYDRLKEKERSLLGTKVFWDEKYDQLKEECRKLGLPTG